MSVVVCVIAVVVSFVAGGLLFAFFVARRWEETYQQVYCVAAVGQLDVVRRIEAGEAEQLVQEIVGAIPHYLTAVDEEFSPGEVKDDLLYAASRFYEATHREVPEAARVLLAKAPKRRVTCFKLQRLCSTDIKCIPLPTSLRPVSDIPDPNGFEKGKSLCGTKKGFFFRSACGAPLSIGVCFR